VFVESVFYVGKGKHSRSTQHLRDAREVEQKTGPVSRWMRVVKWWINFLCLSGV